MKLTWHYPNFVDTDERTTVEFNSKEEFYALPRIVELSAQPDFLRWSQSKELLMLECKDESFWAIAYLSEDTKLDLPKWEEPLNSEVNRINRQLPARVFDLKTYEKGKSIAAARANDGGLELQFAGETAWTPVDRKTLGIAWGR